MQPLKPRKITDIDIVYYDIHRPTNSCDNISNICNMRYKLFYIETTIKRVNQKKEKVPATVFCLFFLNIYNPYFVNLSLNLVKERKKKILCRLFETCAFIYKARE